MFKKINLLKNRQVRKKRWLRGKKRRDKKFEPGVTIIIK